MSQVSTTRAVNLSQLATATGWALSLAATEGERRVVCHTTGVTTAALQSAVGAHVAIDEDANEATIRGRAEQALGANLSDIATNDTFLGIANPTNAQLAGQVKELTRQSTRQARELNALVRLVLRRFDGTD